MRYTSRVRREYLDNIEYIGKLNDKEKEWLSNFNEEWLSANFNHNGKKLHKSKKSKREIYSRNNARNRDMLAIAKASGAVRYDTSGSFIDNETASGISQEDTINQLLDYAKVAKSCVDSDKAAEKWGELYNEVPDKAKKL